MSYIIYKILYNEWMDIFMYDDMKKHVYIQLGGIGIL